MNTLYLNRTKGELYDYYKAGFAGTFETRTRAYITCNPCIEFLEGVHTQPKTKFRLEKAAQKELEEMGFERVYTNGTKTEWFKVPKGTELHLNDLKCCKGRKVFSLE